MSLTRCALLVAVILGSHSVSALSAAQGQRPSTQRRNQPAATFIDTAPPPQELRAMVEGSVAIIHARVAHTGEPLVLPASAGLVGRYQTMRVLEVLTGDAKIAAHASVRIFEYGGTIDVDGRDVSTRFNGLPLRVGEEVVVFLEKPARIDGYTVAYGDAGLFRIDNNRDKVAVPPTVRALVRDFDARAVMSRAEFFDLLRRVVGKSQEDR